MQAALYSKASRHLQQVRQELGSLEGSNDFSPSRQGHLSVMMSTTKSSVAAFVNMIEGELSIEKRIQLKNQAKQLEADLADVEKTFKFWKTNCPSDKMQFFYNNQEGRVPSSDSLEKRNFTSQQPYNEMCTSESGRGYDESSSSRLDHIGIDLDQHIELGSLTLLDLKRQRDILKVAYI